MIALLALLLEQERAHHVVDMAVGERHRVDRAGIPVAQRVVDLARGRRLPVSNTTEAFAACAPR